MTQHKFSDCRDKIELPFDFYLPDYNMCIEYDGIQHFKDNGWFRDSCEQIQKRDKIKDGYCLGKGIRLVRINYKEKNKVEDMLNKLFISK